MCDGQQRIHIGTSGWAYPHWRGEFYPRGLDASRWLGYYAQRFASVEVDSTFYRLPDRHTVCAWRDAVGERFVFSIKVSRYVTHMKKLRDAAESLAPFLEAITPLRPMLGALLFQLPPRWHANPDRLRACLASLQPPLRCAFEFRDASWHNDEVYALLREHDCALCISDLDGRLSPIEFTAGFTYVRLHGPRHAYRGSYGPRSLARWAERLLRWADGRREIYCYFDNDARAMAAQNAGTLQGMVATASGSQRVDP